MAAVTRVQTFARTQKADGVGSTVTHALTSVPTAGNLLVACLSSGDNGGAVTISSFNDNIGDSVSWTASTLNPQGLTTGSSTNYRIYYKVVGTPSGGLKDVQCTITGTNALALFVGEYGVASGTPTWAVTGSQIFANGVTPTFPADAGDITTTIADAVLVGFSGCAGSAWLAGSGYTQQATANAWASDAVEDKLVTSTGTYAVDWTSGGGDDNWIAMGIAFGATEGGGGPTVSTVSSNNANEGTSIVHTVTLASAVTGSPAVYSIALAGVTATGGGVDFTSALTNSEFSDGVTISGGNITVPVAVSSFTVTVPTINDVMAEPAETYTLTVGGTSGTGTINASDAEYGVMATQITRHGKGRHASYGLQRGYT